MRVLFIAGLLCLTVLFLSKLETAFSGRVVDMVITAELGLLLSIYLMRKFFKEKKISISFFVISSANFFYFSYLGFYYPLGGWLFSVINAFFYAVLLGVPVLWIVKIEKYQAQLD